MSICNSLHGNGDIGMNIDFEIEYFLWLHFPVQNVQSFDQDYGGLGRDFDFVFKGVFFIVGEFGEGQGLCAFGEFHQILFESLQFESKRCSSKFESFFVEKLSSDMITIHRKHLTFGKHGMKNLSYGTFARSWRPTYGNHQFLMRRMRGK